MQYDDLQIFENSLDCKEGHTEKKFVCVCMCVCVCVSVCGGQKNIKNYFCLKTHFQWFSGIGNTDMSVDQSRATSRGPCDPPPHSGSKEHQKLFFL